MKPLSPQREPWFLNKGEEFVTQYTQLVKTCYPTGMCSVRNKGKHTSRNSTEIYLVFQQGLRLLIIVTARRP